MPIRILSARARARLRRVVEAVEPTLQPSAGVTAGVRRRPLTQTVVVKVTTVASDQLAAKRIDADGDVFGPAFAVALPDWLDPAPSFAVDDVLPIEHALNTGVVDGSGRPIQWVPAQPSSTLSPGTAHQALVTGSDGSTILWDFIRGAP